MSADADRSGPTPQSIQLDRAILVEIFRERYRLNDDYHNRKEDAAWTASGAYLAFVAGSSAWLLANCSTWLPWRIYIAAFLALLLILVTLFLVYQNWNRVRSVVITEQLDGRMEALLKQTLSASEFQELLRYPTGKSSSSGKWLYYWSRGRMGNAVLTATVLFGVSHMLLVVYVGQSIPVLAVAASALIVLLLLLGTLLLGRSRKRSKSGEAAPAR